LRQVPVEKVKEFERNFLDLMRAKHQPTLAALKAGQLTDEVTDTLAQVCAEVAAAYKN